MIEELAAQLNVTLPSSGGPRQVELRIPPLLRALGLVEDDSVPYDHARAIRESVLVALHFIDRVDGVRVSSAAITTLHEDPVFASPFLSHIRTLIDTYRERGKIFALCPGCQRWEPEMSFTAYALTVAKGIPSSFEGPSLAPAWVASRTLSNHGRPRMPRAARIRFELPSKYLELAAPFTDGILGEVSHQVEDDQEDPADDLLDDDEEEELDDPPYRPHRSGPGWRAVLRLSRAISPAVSVETLEQLSCFDLFFLDLVHYLTQIAHITADTPGKLECPTCRTIFLPVLPDPGALVFDDVDRALR